MVATRSMTRQMTAQNELNSRSKNVPCKFFDSGLGYCRHADRCYYSHALATEAQSHRDETCMICYESTQSWGLLEKCPHAFCLECITRWRKLDVVEMDDTNTDNQRTCPVCRTKSRLILPSNYLPSVDQKERLLAAHIARCAALPCKYFQQFLPGKTFAGDPLMFYCPYFNDCLYEHEYAGTEFVFDDAMIERQKDWLEHQNDDLFEYMSETDSDFTDNSMSDEGSQDDCLSDSGSQTERMEGLMSAQLSESHDD